MRIEDVARTWGINVRAVYRLITDGVLYAEEKPRVTILTGYDIEDTLVHKVKECIKRHKKRKLKPSVVKKILIELKGDKPENYSEPSK